MEVSNPEYSEHDRYRKYEDKHWWFVARRQFLRRILERFSTSRGSVLEYGAGTGYNLLKLFGDFKDRIGVEINENAVSIARARGIQIYHATIEDFEPPTVDLVAFLDVLYHRRVDVNNALERAYQALRPGGCLMIFDGAFDILGGRQSRTVDSGRRFHLSSLKNSLHQHGYSVMYGNYWGVSLYFLMLIKRRVLDLFIDSDDDISFFANRFFGFLMRIENYFALRMRIPFGASVVIFAKKPADQTE